KKCCDMDPLKRPTIGELWRFANKKFKESNNSGSLIKRLFKFSNISNSSGSSSSSPQIHKSHPLAYHTSRILDDEIAKSKSLKSNDSSLNDLDFNMLTLSSDSNE